MNLDTFREWMGIEDGLYSRSYDLRKRVLEPSKKELDANCPWSFDFTEIKENPGNKRSKVIRYIIIPRHIIENENKTLYKQSLQSKITARLQLSPQAYEYLRITSTLKSMRLTRTKRPSSKPKRRFQTSLGSWHPLQVHQNLPISQRPTSLELAEEKQRSTNKKAKCSIKSTLCFVFS